MTQEKAAQEAKELVEKFQSELSGALYSPYNNISAKQCALISLQREKELLAKLHSKIPLDLHRACRNWRISIENEAIENEQITNEIEKL